MFSLCSPTPINIDKSFLTTVNVKYVIMNDCWSWLEHIEKQNNEKAKIASHTDDQNDNTYYLSNKVPVWR
jgi:hypothetical protein